MKLKETRFKTYLGQMESVLAVASAERVETFNDVIRPRTVQALALHDARMVELLNKSMELLRRVYNDIEMHHLEDHKTMTYYVDGVKFHRRLGTDIFNFLQSRDQVFRQTTIRRQRLWRKRAKNRKVAECL